MIFRIIGSLAISAKFRKKNDKKGENTQNCWKSEVFKGSKPESSVNRLNLFKVLIVWSTSFLKGCAICSSDSSSSFSWSPSVITSAGCLENSEIIYSTNNGRDCLVSSRTCTSRNVELNGNFTVRSIFVKLFQCFILCF